MRYIIIVLLLVSQTVSSQQKRIEGDTTYYYRQNYKLITKLGLTDFQTSKYGVVIRLWRFGQVVEVIRDKNHITAELTNFTYHTFRKRTEILFEKTKLDSVTTVQLFELIQHSGVLLLPTDRAIEGWHFGCDGDEYLIEQADSIVYLFKQYWTPSAQGSLPEAKTVMSFENALFEKLQLSKRYQSFHEGLPKYGSYNAGGMVVTSYKTEFIDLGYSVSTKLPMGVAASASVSYLSTTPLFLGMGVHYNWDRKENFHLRIDGVKGRILFRKDQLNDFVSYVYQKRKLDFVHPLTIFQNHQIQYGINLKELFSFSTGIDLMSDEYSKTGGIFNVSKYLSKPGVRMYYNSSIFRNEFDYKLGISKWIGINRRSILRSITPAIEFERFKGYSDVSLICYVGF